LIHRDGNSARYPEIDHYNATPIVSFWSFYLTCVTQLALVSINTFLGIRQTRSLLTWAQDVMATFTLAAVASTLLFASGVWGTLCALAEPLGFSLFKMILELKLVQALWLSPLAGAKEKELMLRTAARLNKGDTACFDKDRAQFFLHLSAVVNRADGDTEGEHSIAAQAAMWGLDVLRVPSLGESPYRHVYIFSSSAHDFLVVVFRGTHPLSLRHWLSDAFMPKHFDSVLGGAVHCGLHNAMFGSWGCCRPDKSKVSFLKSADKPQEGGNLWRSLQTTISKSPSLRNISHMWATGHSLGGSMATLFHAKCLAEPLSISGTRFMGSYVFGSPCVGDTEFSKTFNGRLASRQNCPRPLLCVINANDVLASLPIGGCPQLLPGKALDYQCVGDVWHLHAIGALSHREHTWVRGAGDAALEYVRCGRLLVGALPKLLKFQGSAAAEQLLVQEAFLIPSMLRDHTPASYLRNLSSSNFEQ